VQINPKPTLREVGGKAYQLFKLKRFCDVPPFYVISFEDSQEIQDPEVQRVILKHAQPQGFDLMAVRSSASCEDSPGASFAGMFETVLSVRRSELIDAIKKVLGSVHSKRVADYCQTRGIDHEKIRMAVIIQRMVRSRVSGVCLTRMQKGTNSLIIEACYGLGEALVSGKVTPDSYVLDRSTLTIEKESIGYQKLMLNLPPNRVGQPVYEPVPFHRRNARKLSDGEIRKVATTSLEIEKRLAFEAADIEWAFEGEALYVLQARPLSVL